MQGPTSPASRAEKYQQLHKPLANSYHVRVRQGFLHNFILFRVGRRGRRPLRVCLHCEIVKYNCRGRRPRRPVADSPELVSIRVVCRAGCRGRQPLRSKLTGIALFEQFRTEKRGIIRTAAIHRFFSVWRGTRQEKYPHGPTYVAFQQRAAWPLV